MTAGTRRDEPRNAAIRVRTVSARIVIIRGTRVILDRDLAALYGVTTRALNQAVSRNRMRFPSDFAFTLTGSELSQFKSQSVTSSGHGGRRKRPRAFSEHGVAMLSSVLRSRRAVHANVAIMRAFVRLREIALTHVELTAKIEELERKYDGRFSAVFKALRQLMTVTAPPDPPRRRIGFLADHAGDGGATAARSRY